MSEPALYSWSEFAHGLLLGLISSGLIGYFFYVLQRRKDEKEQREFTVFLYTLWKQSAGVEEITSRVEEKLDQLLRQPPSTAKIDEIEARFNQMDRKLRKVFRKRPKGEYIESVATYKALADARADAAMRQFDFALLAAEGTITVQAIRKAHEDLFPEGYAWSGKLRDQMVTIIGDFRAGGRNIAPSGSSYVVNVLSPEEIPIKLEELVARWNDTVKYIKKDDLKSVVSELAHFHHDFLFIHPFFDGNGRIARVILNEQATFLTGTRIKLEFDQTKYFEALHMGDQRIIGPLSGLIYNEIKKNIEQSH
jgi:fido (protein-threonine AMPylation protein)